MSAVRDEGMTMRVAIIGAGMAGLACGEKLAAAGHSVALFDKGRGPGGRMSARRTATAAGEASFDHGAQYFTAREAAFVARVAAWERDGVVARWGDAGSEAWVGAPAMNAPVKAMAAGLDVTWCSLVEALPLRDGRYDAVVVAAPAEQAGVLLRPWDAGLADLAAGAVSAPCWTVMAAFAERVDVAGNVLREEGIIGWASRNSAKPGRGGPESWVIQAGPDWSRAHLEDRAESVAADLLGAFAGRLGVVLPDVLAATAHRWRYARCGAGGMGPRWNGGLGLGVCGDWVLGPRVECAWLSGDGLADAILAEGLG